MKVKVCGMKYEDNIRSVSLLKPDYMGFIFYERSKRDFKGSIPSINKEIKKVGVFVNEELETIKDRVERFGLDAIQLHGDESANDCDTILRELPGLELIKAFSMSESFDFKRLEAYLKSCDYFLFDTKGKERGGNGTLFDWSILEDYPFEKPFFLSGGIGLEEIPLLRDFLQSDAATFCKLIDVNSKFEIEPGVKNVEELERFIEFIEKEK